MRIVAGEWGGRRLKAPPGRDTRPTTDRVREAWFSALGGAVLEARVLDLFAGSGALGLEALSRGAREAVFVERARRPLAALEENVRTLSAGERVTVVRGDALAYARRLPAGAFDLALADPPYDGGFAQALVDLWMATPFADELWVEHRTGAELRLPPGTRQRRYGDTTLTVLGSAGDGHRARDGQGAPLRGEEPSPSEPEGEEP